MKTKLLTVFVFIFSLLLFHTPCESSEQILSFDSHITVHEDASLTIVETIRVRAEGTAIKRGIYRDFPTRYEDSSGNDYIVGFDLLSVLRDGGAESFHTENRSNGKRIYIGSKDVFLNPGVYTYAITYRTTRQLGFFKDHDELYWNVTGNGWEFPIDRATATVELPSGAAGRVMEIDAYTGPQGAKEKDFSTWTDEAGLIHFKTTRLLGFHEGLTILVSWPKGVVREPTGSERMGYFISDNRALVVGIAGLLLLLLYYLLAWNRVGRDPARGTIIPLYTPPEGLSPASVRVVRKMGSDNKTFAAALIDMAVKGAVSIAEEGRSYIITKQESSPLLSSEERTVVSKLFGSRSRIALKQENHSLISSAIQAFEKSLKQGLEKVYFIVNRPYFAAGVVLSVLVAGLTVLASLSSGPSEELPFAVVIGIFGGAFSITILKLWKSGRKISAVFLLIVLSLFFMPLLLFLPFAAKMKGLLLLFLVVLFLNVLFYYLLKAPTATGRKLMDQIEGFRMFLSVTEKDRLNLLNPPERTPELFEKYLPYALALDVEQEWAEQFTSVLSAARYEPAWYSGSHWNVNRMGGFAGSLGGSFAGVIASSATAPGSSSGGGGGGSSGGGGGGGGGGGW